VGIVRKRWKAQGLCEPRRLDPVLHPPVNPARHQLHGTQTTSVHWQGAIGLFDLAIVRRDTLDKVGKLSRQRRVHARQLLDKTVPLGFGLLICDPAPVVLFLVSQLLQPVPPIAPRPSLNAHARTGRPPSGGGLRQRHLPTKWVERSRAGLLGRFTGGNGGGVGLFDEISDLIRFRAFAKRTRNPLVEIDGRLHQACLQASRISRPRSSHAASAS
jgi:hypothetical protein